MNNSIYMTRCIRELTISYLYQLEHAQDNLNNSSEILCESEKHSVDKKSIQSAQNIAKIIWEAKETYDLKINKYTPEWPIHRQPLIDRNIIRLSIWENNENKSPKNVIINESVELAKEYSTKDSANFINGVLDKIIKY